MSTRHVFALIVVFCTAGQLGCCCMRNSGCGGCGMGGQVYDSCCASCGVADTCCDGPSCGCPDASCGCPEASCGCSDVSCGCPDESCGCPDECGGGVGCGSCVKGECRLLKRIRNALRGCCSSGCCGPAYVSEWQDSPPCNCDSCDQYGNYTGGQYGSPHGRRARMANKNLSDELRFGSDDGDTIYR